VNHSNINKSLHLNPQFLDGGRIGIFYLKSVWNYYQGVKTGSLNLEAIEWKYINGLFNTLRLGTEPSIQYLLQENNSFEEFENWIEANGLVEQVRIDHFNLIIEQGSHSDFQLVEKIFSDSEMIRWAQDGYIILKDAISKEDCAKTVELIYETINANKKDSTSWYRNHPLKNGIMIQLFNSEILNKNRLSTRIKLAYEQLWKRDDLIISMDRVSFNPPETNTYKFPGPNLHWDVSLKRPIPYGLQGLLYLTDTKENQGSFTLIPGFHHILESYLDDLNPEDNPRNAEHLNRFQKKSIAASAGDFIIWNQCLPHGSSPNTSHEPRIVQYINYQPLEMNIQSEWI
jgi:hypothetical protein